MSVDWAASSRVDYDYDYFGQESIGNTISLIDDVLNFEIPDHITTDKKLAPYPHKRYVPNFYKYPEKYRGENHLYCKDILKDRGMWAIVDMFWTKELAKHIGNRSCLEIMAGAGWLAKALSDHGINIITTDDFSWEKTHSEMKRMVNIDKLDAKNAVNMYYKKCDVLICSWPPYCDNTLTEIIKNFWKKTVIYIGEDGCGCTGDEELWEYFHPTTNSSIINIPRWDGIHDDCYIMEK